MELRDQIKNIIDVELNDSMTNGTNLLGKFREIIGYTDADEKEISLLYYSKSTIITDYKINNNDLLFVGSINLEEYMIEVHIFRYINNPKMVELFNAAGGAE